MPDNMHINGVINTQADSGNMIVTFLVYVRLYLDSGAYIIPG